MIEEIQKITNVEYTLTEEVINRKWSVVSSKRRQLLTLSDWTQLADSNVPPAIRHQWKVWRQKIRNIRRVTVTNPTDALELLKSLERQSLESLNYDDVEDSEIKPDDLTMETVKQLIEARINEIIPQLLSVNDVGNILNEKLNEFKKSLTHRDLSDDLAIAKLQAIDLINETYAKKVSPIFPQTELFNEVIDYKVDHLDMGEYPLMEVWKNSYGYSLDEVAAHIIVMKKAWLKALCDTESQRLARIQMIERAKNMEELRQTI